MTLFETRNLQMTDVITLSSDDEDNATTSTDSKEKMTGMATVHINQVQQLNLNDIRTNFDGPTQSRKRSAPAMAMMHPLVVPRSENAYNPINSRNANGRTLARANSHNLMFSSMSSANRNDVIKSSKYPILFEAWEGSKPVRKSQRKTDRRKHIKFVCTFSTKICAKAIMGTIGYTNHLWAHIFHHVPTTGWRNDEEYSQEEREFLLRMMCEFCNAKYNTIYNKQKHVNVCHLKYGKKNVVCRICEIHFSNSEELKIHQSQHVPGEAPYHCQRCKYRSSVRAFLFDHYLKEHSFDALICPICTEMIDVPPKARREKMMMVPEMVTHMRAHASEPNLRCKRCALTFFDHQSFTNHTRNAHSGVPANWTVEERPIDAGRKRKPVIRVETAEKKFLKTVAGRRILDEVCCQNSMERGGFDTSASGNVLYECECGQMTTFNGDRVASHYHRCGKTFKETPFEMGPRREDDDEEELRIFAVVPPFSGAAIERSRRIEEKLKRTDKPEILTDPVALETVSDRPMLNIVATDEDLEKYVAPICRRLSER